MRLPARPGFAQENRPFAGSRARQRIAEQCALPPRVAADLARTLDQFRDLTSKVDERNSSLIEGYIGDRAHKQTSTGCGHSGDRGVEIDDVERQVDESTRRVPLEEAPQR